ncbi:MAG TPA: HAD-IB family hydrolase [Myxococcota bacterium]|nr:HAD-IB family hydrolase [Myxococcota bacterium]
MSLQDDLTREIREGPSGPEVGALFDLDQTLVAGFSATAFLRERVMSGRISPKELSDTLAGALSFALGRTGFSGMLAGVVATYRGLSEAAMREQAEEVFEKRLAKDIYPEARVLVEAHRARGHTLAIVSSALTYQVEPFARALDIPHVMCTRLDVEDGVFTGEVVKPTCWQEGKLHYARVLAEREGFDLAQSYFYSDSADDLALLEAVGMPRPLNPGSRLAGIARNRGWPIRRFTSRGRPDAEAVARTALAYGSIVPSVLVGLGVGFANRSQREGLNVAASAWSELATAFAGITLDVRGEENLWSHRPAVFVFNHQSGVDAMLLAKLLRKDYAGIAKKEIRDVPILGAAFEFAGTVFIDRANTQQAIEAMAPAVEALKQGRSIAIAPEGTRSRTPRLGRFKKGAFHLAMQAGVPIVPIVFKNTLDVLPRGAIVLRPANVEAVVLPPIDTSHWTRETLDAEIEAVRKRFLEVLGQ